MSKKRPPASPLSSGATFDVIHPASEQVAGQATDGTVEDMSRAVAAARRAFDESDWSRDIDFRYHCLNQLHDAFDRNKERLRRILITEVGCPVTVSGSQIESPIEEVKHWAEHGKAFDYLVDPRHRPEWQSSLRRVSAIDGDVRVGQTWVDETKPGLKPLMRTTDWAATLSGPVPVSMSGIDGGAVGPKASPMSGSPSSIANEREMA